MTKVRILIDDPSPKAITRYKKGDIAEVIHSQQRLTSKATHHYKVRLPYRSYCGEGENRKGLAQTALFFKDQVQEIPGAFE